ncbi:alcohol dehydrogenase class-3 isoform X2 [Physcomitrium patens]|uniref:alcohol dehydrogenase class-3 isoform X2 n=1 Tax=Physcomitrium patens TaxID=3218 RepID=UPI000D16CD13|nr:alcohol dehydrogenase class-3-like isoform X2 [Physcomitrium patens]|eukprot:XP_024359176.1 alcohol dehydrogenase class-3-like isoform X2 [Physcomitrella patens]
MAATEGKVITCKAGVAYEANKPLSFEDIHVSPPQPTEVRVKITHACICQSDLYFWKGKDTQKLFPRILGHEGAGICESVGAQVRHIKAGDKCIPVWQCECTKCGKCKSSKTNICDVFMFNWGSGLMPSDKATTRFTRVEDGKPIYHFFGISVFSQYSTMDEACIAKINPKAELHKICLLGCGIPTGVGSVWNICKVHPGSTVAVFGLGTIGLAVVEACKVSGCSRIIGVARDAGKLQRAMEFGLTDTLNIKSFDKPIEQVIRDMTGGGVDYSFDCTGDPGIIKSALECCVEWGGVSCILGLVESSQRVSFHPALLLWGRVWTSGLFGGYKGRSQLPDLVDRCIKGHINLDHYITHKLPFSKINEAFELLNQGGCIRCVMDYEK